MSTFFKAHTVLQVIYPCLASKSKELYYTSLCQQLRTEQLTFISLTYLGHLSHSPQAGSHLVIRPGFGENEMTSVGMMFSVIHQCTI